MTKCKVCGVNLPDDANFCYECGEKQKNTCSNCEAILLHNAKFCHKCGKEQYLMLYDELNTLDIVEETPMGAFEYEKNDHRYILKKLKYTSLTDVVIPRVFSEIGSQAFFDCSSLTSITIPNSISEIGGQAFYGCSSLTSVTIPNSVTVIRSGLVPKVGHIII